MTILALIRALLRSQSALAIENVALRQQVAVRKRTVKCPRLRNRDRLSRENRFWGAPRIQAELHHLGHHVAKSTVERYMTKRTGPP